MPQLDLAGPGARHPEPPLADRELSGPGPDPRAAVDQLARLRLLITVKTAPEPGDRYERTVCAAGISADPFRPGWIRLTSIPIQELGPGAAFGTYDIISVDARPTAGDSRHENWRPLPRTLVREHHLKRWQWRQPWLEPYLGESVCRRHFDGPALALVRPRRVDELVLVPHPGWTVEQRRRLDWYAVRLDPFGTPDPGPLHPPRFVGAYRYRCPAYDCAGHQQTIRDWEFVALQHRLAGLPDDRLRVALTTAFLDRICGPDRDTAFYLGRSSHQPDTYDVLGVYWPPRR
ncbi:hypothetical protein ACIBF5_25700 [Micromonospora sp. NPDC050417]|uniref:hypothetical protein n=1 Tax=Micromonospora sp. NPDC050417 TaxID=3364280 RepID=UPI0037B890D3